MKKAILFLGTVLIISLFAGCLSVPDTASEGRREKINYTVLEENDIPNNVKTVVEQYKTKGGVKVIKGDNDIQYVFIGLGERRTAGYGVEILSVEEENGKVLIVYREKKPAKDALVAQVITYPYAVVKLESNLPVEVKRK